MRHVLDGLCRAGLYSVVRLDRLWPSRPKVTPAAVPAPRPRPGASDRCRRSGVLLRDTSQLQIAVQDPDQPGRDDAQRCFGREGWAGVGGRCASRMIRRERGTARGVMYHTVTLLIRNVPLCRGNITAALGRGGGRGEFQHLFQQSLMVQLQAEMR